jgi:beta-galactosidase/beta-glucuronidase
MKTSLFYLTALFFVLCSPHSVAQWQPAGERIRTRWGEELDPKNVWNVYPRPLLERTEWKSLNGPWNYAIGPRHSARPYAWDGEILVPFPVESSLSGVKKTVGEDNVVWYERSFTIPSGWRGRDILLHFGAVDWQADVWVNDIRVGTHTGGYTAFYFNITPYLNSRGTQKVVVRVWDPIDKSFQPRGKQVSEPHGIWYTAVTGIWQTVWIEPVDRNHITRIKTTPDVDLKKVGISIETSGNSFGDYAEVMISGEGRVVSTEKFAVSGETEIYLDSPKLWSPESPFLYDLEINLYSGGKVTDRVRSYFAMRKISTGRDRNGIVRIRLNNEDYFPMGTLDQGWWPDGLYTPPSDEAMLYDIEVTKDLGFNMIRKHVKVEPARWYMHCDRAGILVWQDMPSGDQTPVWQMRQYFDGTELKRSSQSETNFRKEWKEVIDLLYSHPSVVTWIPFNEAWGQFKTTEITEWTSNYDPSRLVLPASGGNHFQTGDILGIHNYPQPLLYLYDATRPTVLSEFGGIGLALDGHLWEPDRNWGYIQFNSMQEVTKKYLEYAEELKRLIRSGISGAVYTQTTDVEIEVNGLMTYDRRLIKMDRDMIRQANMEIRKILEQGPAR